MTIEEHVAAAIAEERARRDYQTITGSARRAANLCGLAIPAPLVAYVAETTCTVHEHPCRWADFAFILPDGSFKVLLQNDILGYGLMIEDSAKCLLEKLVILTHDLATTPEQDA